MGRKWQCFLQSVNNQINNYLFASISNSTPIILLANIQTSGIFRKNQRDIERSREAAAKEPLERQKEQKQADLEKKREERAVNFNLLPFGNLNFIFYDF